MGCVFEFVFFVGSDGVKSSAVGFGGLVKSGRVRSGQARLGLLGTLVKSGQVCWSTWSGLESDQVCWSLVSSGRVVRSGQVGLGLVGFGWVRSRLISSG